MRTSRENRYPISSAYAKKRRERAVAALKKRIILTVATFSLLIAGVLIGSNLLDSAESEAENSKELYKYYTSIQVASGDTLWSIADKYRSPEYSDRNAYMQELVALNDLGDTTIHAGQYLTVSYYSDIEK